MTSYISLVSFIFITSFFFQRVDLASTCQDYLSDFPDYECLQENIQKDPGLGTYFLLSKNDQKFALWGRPDSASTQQQLDFLQKSEQNKFVVNIYERKTINGNVLAVFDFPSQMTLQNYSQSPSFNTFDQTRNLILEITKGVAQIHKLGFVVTDLNLENIWVDSEGHPVLVNVEYVLPVGTVTYPRGKLQFMSPELIDQFQEGLQAKYEPADDVYSIGVIYYFLMKQTYPLKNELKNFANIQLNLILFNEGDKKEFVQVVWQTVIKSNERVAIDRLEEILEGHKLKPNFEKIEEDQFYTLDLPQMQHVSSATKYLFIGLLALIFLFLICFVFFLLRCMCKTASFMLCCPCLFGNKKKKEKKDLNVVIVQDFKEDKK